MSSQVFPSLPGLSVSVTREDVHEVDVQSTRNGQELRVRRWAGPKYRYRLSFNGLRKSGVSEDEVSKLRTFFNGHGGSWDSFLFDDPDDGVRRRVRFEDPVLSLEQVAKGLWRVDEVSLLTTSVDYGSSGGANLSAAASGVILPATDDATTWLMTISDDGSLYTGKLAAVAGGQVHADVILVASDLSRWRVTVLGAESGRLVTTADATSDPTTTISLASPNGTTFNVFVDTDGALDPQEA